MITALSADPRAEAIVQLLATASPEAVRGLVEAGVSALGFRVPPSSPLPDSTIELAGRIADLPELGV
jgi:hypothetical protein